MKKFSWLKALFFGGLLWVVMFVLGSLFSFVNVVGAGVWGLALTAVVMMVSFTFAIYADSANSKQALGYGAVWSAVVIALGLIASQSIQAYMYSSWAFWASIAVVLVVPWIEYEISITGKRNPFEDKLAKNQWLP